MGIFKEKKDVNELIERMFLKYESRTLKAINLLRDRMEKENDHLITHITNNVYNKVSESLDKRFKELDIKLCNYSQCVVRELKEEALTVEDLFSMRNNIIKEVKTYIEPQKKEAIGVEVLLLTPRTYNALIAGGVDTIEKLTNKTETSLSAMKGLGNKSRSEIINKLSKINLSIKEVKYV